MAGAVRADILEATGGGREEEALLASALGIDMERTVIEIRGE
jgi:hypothetical protein